MPLWFFSNSTESKVSLAVPEPVGWEKYAPGPVRVVTAADTHAPKAKKARKEQAEKREQLDEGAPKEAAIEVGSAAAAPEAAPDQLAPAVAAVAAAAPGAAQIRIPDLSELGCPKCRGAGEGCAQCKDEGYRRRRIARLQAQAAKAAAAQTRILRRRLSQEAVAAAAVVVAGPLWAERLRRACLSSRFCGMAGSDWQLEQHNS